MLAYQGLNQILVQVSQTALALQLSPLRVTSVSTQPKKPVFDVICSESFLHTLELLKQSDNAKLFEHLPDVRFGASGKNAQFLHCNNLTFKFSSGNSVKGDRLFIKGLNNLKAEKNFEDSLEVSKSPWQVSYKSCNSFEENKMSSSCNASSQLNNFSSKHVHSQTNVLCCTRVANFLHSNQSSLRYSPTDIQLRGFKTERNYQSEMKRNPGVFGRLRSLFDLSLSTQLSNVKSANHIANDHSKLKTLLADESLSPEQKAKVAFAEGYVHGLASPARNFIQKSLNIFRNVCTGIVLIYIIFKALSNYSSDDDNTVFSPGSMFKITLGTKNEIDPEQVSVTFDDVRGATEAKQELQDIVDFLKNPQKFTALGGKLPKGMLLVGPPGTGKTLLARAVAGEAGVPFFHASGSEFDEMLVGQGARRIRDLFKAAKQKAPCVVFIDEVDSVGSKRSSTVLHPYANQTINQLLTEMDGFHQNEGVIVLGATNRKQDLDKALLRPGRFDIEVIVQIPSLMEREQILDLYLSKIQTNELNVASLAKETIGYTGADIESMVNQAALRAASLGASNVTMEHLRSAMDKVRMGPERRSLVRNEEDIWLTAYHESGHALVSFYTKDSPPPSKITIIPRSYSFGHTFYLPKKEPSNSTKSEMLAFIDVCMGGRAGEELIYGTEKITVGIYDDLKKATEMATAFVKLYGMSDKVGLRNYESGGPWENSREFGPSTMDQIDNEIKVLLQESYERAKSVLKTHSKEHKLLAEALMKYETLDGEDVKAILSGTNFRDKK